MKRSALSRSRPLRRKGGMSGAWDALVRRLDAPLRRSGRAQDRRRIYAELDALAREIVFRRARFVCERCKQDKPLQWSHIYPRRYLRLRWRPENALALCRGCHRWWHLHPLEAAAWLDATQPGRAMLLLAAMHGKQKVDLGLERQWLEREVARAGLAVSHPTKGVRTC